MSHAYQYSDEDHVKSWKRIHGNGEETHVHIVSCGERYVVLAGDVDPREFAAVGSGAIAYSPTLEAAQERAEAWMEQHPKGILGESESSGGVGSKLIGALRKLNDYGNSLQEQQTAEDN